MGFMDDAKAKADEMGKKMEGLGEDIKDKADDVRDDALRKEGELKGRMEEWEDNRKKEDEQ